MFSKKATKIEKIFLILCSPFENSTTRIVVAIITKFMFSKKATKIDKIFTVDLTLCSKCQMDGEDFINFCGFLRKHEL